MHQLQKVCKCMLLSCKRAFMVKCMQIWLDVPASVLLTRSEMERSSQCSCWRSSRMRKFCKEASELKPRQLPVGNRNKQSCARLQIICYLKQQRHLSWTQTSRCRKITWRCLRAPAILHVPPSHTATMYLDCRAGYTYQACAMHSFSLFLSRAVMWNDF